MSVLYIVVPLAIVVALAAVIAYRWAARRGQFDDLVTPAIRMLNDDVEPKRGEAGSDRERPGGDCTES